MELNCEFHAPALLPRGKSSDIPWINELAGAELVCTLWRRKKNLLLCRESNPDSSVIQPLD